MREAARALLGRDAPWERLIRLRDQGNFDPDLWREAGAMGWPGALIPEPVGLGLRFEDACGLLAEAGRALAPIPLASSLLAGRLLAEAGAEPEALDQVAAGTTFAVAGGRHGQLVRDAAVAAWLLSVEGDSLRLLPRSGASTVPRLTAGRLREASVELLEGAGRACGVLPGAESRLQTLRLLFEAAEMAGACERVLEISAEHVNNRRQFGRTLGSFQSVQHRLADMLTDLDGTRWLLWRTAAELDAGRPAAGLAVRLGIWTRQASGRIVASALQVHGGVAFIRDHPLHMYFGRQKSCELSFGSLEDLRQQAAAELLGPIEEDAV